jgi:hypothetical protein
LPREHQRFDHRPGRTTRRRPSARHHSGADSNSRTDRIDSCTILDISTQGGQVRLDAKVTVPDHFVLWLTKTGSVRRECRVVWRRENYLGLQFAGRFNHNEE